MQRECIKRVTDAIVLLRMLLLLVVEVSTGSIASAVAYTDASLWYRLALHVMCFSNARAIAGLWQRFVRYLREGCWDQGRLLPRMAPVSSFPSHHQHKRQQEPAVAAAGAARAGVSAGGSALPRPDFSCCVLHQKLQMLNLCIQQAHGLLAGRSQEEPQRQQV